MSTVHTFEPPVLAPQPATGKWAREYEAFLRLLPELLPAYRGQYVAIHDGRVIGSGADKLAVAKAAYAAVGPTEVLVRLVTDAPPRVVRLASPQVGEREGG